MFGTNKTILPVYSVI